MKNRREDFQSTSITLQLLAERLLIALVLFLYASLSSLHPRVLIGKICCNTPSWCTLNKSKLKQKRFIHIFYCLFLFPNSCCNGIQANRTALKIFHYSFE